MIDPRHWLSAVLFALVVAGCSRGPVTGPEEVKWDRYQCERCRMVVSDRNHAAQVRQPLGNGRSKVFHFDDFGCAVIWLEDKPWKDNALTEFWITDHKTGEWIDARAANYVTGGHTPMGYGLGAQHSFAEGTLSFEQAKAQVLRSEHRHDAHAAHQRFAPGN